MSSLRYDRADEPVPKRQKKRAFARQWPASVDCPVEGQQTRGKRPSSFLSIIVPAKNEAANLAQLIDEIALALRPLCQANHRELAGFEIILVDDGSIDATVSVTKGLMVFYPELHGLVVAKSVGQSGAIMVGIRAARGQWIATLDADLQNDPADLVRLWRALNGPNSAVLGWRMKRRDRWSKRIVSFWANKLRNTVLRQSIIDTGCSVRIFPRKLALRMPMFAGMHRFFGPLLLREGCTLIQIPVHHRARRHGRSHYNCWNRSFQVVVDLIGVAWLLRRSVHCELTRTRGMTRYDAVIQAIHQPSHCR
jgi:dolichol-phosphate mannosyltransferase